MSHLELSSYEVKQLAAYLKASSALAPSAIPKLKLSEWREAISHASGFRDWNTMAAVAPDVPEVTWGEWQSGFFGIVQIHVQGQPSSVQLSGFRNSIPGSASSRHEVAHLLAQSCLDHVSERFHGLEFTYSRPDFQNDSFFDIHPITPDGKLKGPSPKPWRASTPLVLISADKRISANLWWIEERYTMAEFLPERERRFSCHSLRFNDHGCPRTGVVYNTRIPMSLTDLFLHQLTGVARLARTCYYVPEVANAAGETFAPLLVREGYSEGGGTSLNSWLLREDAIEQARGLNAKDGITQLDADSIAQTFCEYEVKAEEIEFDNFGSSPYDD